MQVAGLLSSHARVDLAVSNISSLAPEDAASIQNLLGPLLANRGLRLSGSEPVSGLVQVTISQNADGFLLVAQVKRDAEEKVAIVSVPGAVKSPPRGEGVLLDAKLISEQPTQILDFALPAAPPGSQTILAVLEPRRLAFYSQNWTGWQLVRELPSGSAVVTRNWRGHLDVGQGAGQTDARWTGNECKGDFAHPHTVNCQTSNSGDAWISGSVRQPFSPVGGGDAIGIGSQCRTHSIALATGGGDWTQPDFVQAYEMPSGPGSALASGSPINFDGPVTAIWPGAAPATARVIVHNLRTGNYEAYVVTATCSQQ